jgi:hypothetical protein
VLAPCSSLPFRFKLLTGMRQHRVFSPYNICFYLRRPGELENLTREVIGQIRRLALTGKSRQDRMFLGVDVGRLGYINRGHLRDMCVNHHLPSDPDIIDLVSFNEKFVTIYVLTSIDFSYWRI